MKTHPYSITDYYNYLEMYYELKSATMSFSWLDNGITVELGIWLRDRKALKFISMTLPIENVCDEDNPIYPNAGKIRDILISQGHDIKELSLDYQNVHKNLVLAMKAIGYSPNNRERYKDVLYEEENLRKTYSDYNAKELTLKMQKSGIETEK